METEVLQDIAEEVVRYGERAFLQVVIEALLQVSGHLGWQVAGSWAIWGLRDIEGLLVSALFSGHIDFFFWFEFQI